VKLLYLETFCLLKSRFFNGVECFFIVLFFACTDLYSWHEPYPIQFSIPETKIVQSIPKKNRDFAFIIPGNMSTYIYKNEVDYYQDYQRSYYAITCKKGGWDCMRHYEILANGCIPYFLDLDKCDSRTMALLTRDLIKEAMNLPGVSYLKIDHKKFDEVRYFEILQKLLDYTKIYLTTRSMAQYVLDTIHYKGDGKILYLSRDIYSDYMRDLILIGLREIYGDSVVDFPKIDFIYKNYTGNISRFWGKGFTYTKILEDIPVDRDNIVQRIKDRKFDLIIYGSVHRGMPYIDLVRKTYPTDKIVYICGEDIHSCEYRHLPNLFLREQ
jgi:hypothetical protein